MNSFDDFGRFATRAFVDLALVCYFLSAIVALLDRGKARSWRSARAIYTVGCLFYLAHVACAFHIYHHWSHREAYAETARRTAELFGWHSGGGLYFNYAFTLGWTLDVLWQWLSPASYLQRPRWLSLAWHGFFLFMVINATIIFETGPVRWLGISGCLALIAACAISRRRPEIA